MCNSKNQIGLLTCLMLSTGVNAQPGQQEGATALIPRYGEIILSQGRLSLVSWCFSRQILLPAQCSVQRSMLTPCVGTFLSAVGIENTSFRHWQNTSHDNTYLSGYTSPPCDYVIPSDSSLFKLLASRKRSYSVTYPFLISTKRCGWVK